MVTNSVIIGHYRSSRQSTCEVRDFCVLESADWIRRAGTLVRPPKRFLGASQADTRYDACRGSCTAVIHSVVCDVAFASDTSEAQWARSFTSAINDDHWCSERNLFDSQLLFGRPYAGCSNDHVRRNDAERRREGLAQ